MGTIAGTAYEKMLELSGIRPLKGETEDEICERGMAEIERKMAEKQAHFEQDARRVADILEVVMALAELNYTRKAELSEKSDYIDGLAAGINMLGEELKGSTVSLHEKEVLLKEVHHRVKNNLQVISSLLNLQADQISEPVFREKYLTGRDRILSMALVHEKLYESKDFSLVDFNDYTQSLARSLNLSYNPDSARIRLETVTAAGTAGMFHIETAIPCGLILNELISNCFKYAFPGERSGTVTVRFDAAEKKDGIEYLLGVSDDGIGLPEGMTEKKEETLGMQLIEMLSGQINGSLSINGKKGTDISVRFMLKAD